MDISLNISSTNIEPRGSKKKNPLPKSKNKHEKNDFNFKFTKNANVKALARKSSKKFNGTVKSNEAVIKHQTNNSNLVKNQNAASIEKNDDSVSLSLNVTAGSEQDRIQNLKNLEQKSLTKKQKFAQKLEEKKKAYQNQQDQPKKSKPQKSSSKPKNSLFSNNPVVPVIGQRLVKPIDEQVFTGCSMSTMGLHDHAVKNLADILKITELTNVQQRTIPVVLSGRDVLVRSQTGSGKTLAYALPIVQKLQEIRPKITRDGGIQALIIVPTRELAIQSYEIFVKLLKPFTWIVSSYLTGGEKRKTEKARLRKGINILVGTPGRLCDHLLHTESFKLDKVKWLVLDEADRLFECGYEKDVQKIVDVLNAPSPLTLNGDKKNPFNIVPENEVAESKPQIQCLLLSATLTSSVRRLAGLTLKNPMFIDSTDVNDAAILKSNSFNMENSIENETIVIPATVSQSYILVPPKLRMVTLSGMIASEMKTVSKILVFFGTEHLVNFHFDLMNEALTKKILDSDDEGEDNEEDDDDDNGEDHLFDGIRLFKLHGSLTQQERSAVFKAFRESKSGVLFTTDVAARGIDIPMVDLIVQFSPPQNISDYVHRVGRTARAGRSGRTILFLAPNETDFIRMLEDKKIRISQDDFNKFLKGIRNSLATNTLEECASELQRKFESIIEDDKEMHDKACKDICNIKAETIRLELLLLLLDEMQLNFYNTIFV